MSKRNVGNIEVFILLYVYMETPVSLERVDRFLFFFLVFPSQWSSNVRLTENTVPRGTTSNLLTVRKAYHYTNEHCFSLLQEWLNLFLMKRSATNHSKCFRFWPQLVLKCYDFLKPSVPPTWGLFLERNGDQWGPISYQVLRKTGPRWCPYYLSH